ncbi:MAG: glycosyltransferase N-terminal domain-containing protein [Ferruginibacter sp.]
MSLFLYNIFLFLYSAGIKIASLWNQKALQWIKGRKLFPVFESRKTVWMHCASLGEFEQGRPVIEKIKEIYPEYKIVITFFSPSGYEIKKNFPGADAIFYLPMDSKIISEKFIETLKPDLVLWVKYEYWYHYLTALKKKNIPVILVSGIFRESQPFFKWYGKIWREMLVSFEHLFVQNEDSLNLIEKLVPGKVSVNGDTRFDRVADIADNWQEVPDIAGFCGNSKVIVAGSTWEDDKTIMIHFINTHPEVKFIIAPHEIEKEKLTGLLKKFKNVILYSELEKKHSGNQQVLIIDNIGMLSRLYKYATIAYVGGGFNTSGIHNILEAAVYGRPVVFGPEYQNFTEAIALVEKGGAFSVNNALELEKLISYLLSEETALIKISAIAKEYVYNNRGATGRITDYIAEKRLLIN